MSDVVWTVIEPMKPWAEMTEEERDWFHRGIVCGVARVVYVTMEECERYYGRPEVPEA